MCVSVYICRSMQSKQLTAGCLAADECICLHPHWLPADEWLQWTSPQTSAHLQGSPVHDRQILVNELQLVTQELSVSVKKNKKMCHQAISSQNLNIELK